MKKRVISILMMAMMVLSYSGFAVFAVEPESNQGNEQPAVTEEAPAPEEEVTKEEPAPAVEEEPAPTEDITEDVVTEEGTDTVEEVEDVSEDGMTPAMEAIESVVVEGNRLQQYLVTWAEFEGADFYKVFFDDSEVASNLTTPRYQLKGADPGMHAVKVEAWTTDGEAPIASSSTSFTWEDMVPEVWRIISVSGYNFVSVRWTKNLGTVGQTYRIERATKPDGPFTELVTIDASQLNTYTDSVGNWYKYKDTTAKGKNTNYYYKVYVIRKSDGKESDCSITSNGRGKVRAIAYFVTTKTKKTLTSHDGKNKKVTIAKGTRLECEGFGGGKYKFYYKVGGTNYYFYINAISTKKASAQYTKSFNYTREEAEDYINAKGTASRTGYLVWANLYTQHVYVLKGSKGKWKCVNDFECSSGSAKRPSPSGDWKEIHKRIKNRHSRPYWSCYSDINAFHSVKNAGKKNEQGVGYPDSNGCIRLKKPNAYYIYYTVPMKSKVVVY